MQVADHWEAEDFRRHPDYQELDAQGNLVIQAKDLAPNRIPFSAPQPVEARRPILTVKRKTA
jgi:hypothetical protein